MSRPKCLRCGADSAWIQGRVPDEPSEGELAAPAGSAVCPEWTDKEMDAIAEMAKAKDVSRAAVIRAAVRLYQAVHAGACTVTWPRQNDKLSYPGDK